MGSVDPADQYRFDYSDVGFGSVHSSGWFGMQPKMYLHVQRRRFAGATVTVTCTQNGVLGITYAMNHHRAIINRGISIVASCEAGEEQ